MTVDPLTVLREAPDSPFGPGDSDRYYAALAAVEQLVEAARVVVDCKGSYGYHLFNQTAAEALAAALARFEGDSQQGTAA